MQRGIVAFLFAAGDFPKREAITKTTKTMTLRAILLCVCPLKQVSCAHIKKTLCDAKGFQYRWGLSPFALLHATSPRGELQPKQQKHDPTGHFIQHAHVETSFMCTHKKNPLRCKRFSVQMGIVAFSFATCDFPKGGATTKTTKT